MNEFDLQMWERELGAWQRRLVRQPPGALRSALDDLAVRVHALRERPRDDVAAENELRRCFATLRALYDSEELLSASGV
jgi:hypothetical protein